MITATLHGGPRDGETVELPWARIEIPLPRFEGAGLEGIEEDLYKLRGPWRGQDWANYDYVEKEAA
jgi:hypothetical protein